MLCKFIITYLSIDIYIYIYIYGCFSTLFSWKFHCLVIASPIGSTMYKFIIVPLRPYAFHFESLANRYLNICVCIHIHIYIYITSYIYIYIYIYIYVFNQNLIQLTEFFYKHKSMSLPWGLSTKNPSRNSGEFHHRQNTSQNNQV